MTEINPAEVLRKCQNNEKITWAEYCVGANRTASSSFYGNHYKYAMAMKMLSYFVSYGRKLDEMKKALYYGKNLEETYEGHYAAAGGVTLDTEKEWPKNIDVDLLHSVLGIATESVELVENLINIMTVLYDDPDSVEQIDVINILEEFGDLLWYMHLPFTKLDMEPDLNNILRTNLLKLAQRYPEKFTEDLAVNRDLEAERDILEQNMA